MYQLSDLSIDDVNCQPCSTVYTVLLLLLLFFFIIIIISSSSSTVTLLPVQLFLLSSL